MGLIELARSGKYSTTELAKRYKRTRGTIYDRLAPYEVNVRHCQVIRKQSIIHFYYRLGYTLKQIAEHLHLSYSRVRTLHRNHTPLNGSLTIEITKPVLSNDSRIIQPGKYPIKESGNDMLFFVFLDAEPITVSSAELLKKTRLPDDPTR